MRFVDWEERGIPWEKGGGLGPGLKEMEGDAQALEALRHFPEAGQQEVEPPESVVLRHRAEAEDDVEGDLEVLPEMRRPGGALDCLYF